MTIAACIEHRETGGSVGRPRHPIVFALDLLGLAAVLTMLAAFPPCTMAIATLPLAIACLYAASSVHHWFRDSRLRQRFDFLMIAVVIAMTPIPYWGTNLSFADAIPLYVCSATFLAATAAIKWWRVEWHQVGGMLYLVLGLYDTEILWGQLPLWEPTPVVVAFWGGVGLYAVQFLIYTIEKPDPWPGRFGFREIQHAILLIAALSQTWLVLRYL